MERSYRSRGLVENGNIIAIRKFRYRRGGAGLSTAAAAVHPGLHHGRHLPKQEGIDPPAMEMFRMTIRTRLVSAVVLLSVAGLGGCGLYKWKKPGADDAAFQVDSSACQQTRNPDGYAPCMQQRGWTLD